MTRPHKTVHCFWRTTGRILCSILVLSLAVCNSLLAQAPAGDTQAQIRLTDSLAKAGNFVAAKEVIEKVHNAEPKNYEILWRLSKCLSDAADSLESEDEREQMYLRARAAADSAIALRQDGMNAYVRRAIANGKLALFRGVFSVGDLIKDVRDDCEKAIELNNGGEFLLALAHYILGRVHLKVTEKPYLVRWPIGLGFADIDDAIDHLGKASQVQPRNIRFRLDYARALIREDEYESARAQLNSIADLSNDFPGDAQFKQDALNLLAEIKDE